MSTEIKKRNIKKLKVVYSEEVPINIPLEDRIVDEVTKKVTPGSTAFVPSAMGLIIAREVIMDLLKK